MGAHPELAVQKQREVIIGRASARCLTKGEVREQAGGDWRGHRSTTPFFERPPTRASLDRSETPAELIKKDRVWDGGDPMFQAGVTDSPVVSRSLCGSLSTATRARRRARSKESLLFISPEGRPDSEPASQGDDVRSS